MSEIILDEKIPIKSKEISSYLKDEGANIEEKKVAVVDLLIPIAMYFKDLAEVSSVLTTLLIKGEIIVGYKDDITYYGKSKSV